MTKDDKTLSVATDSVLHRDEAPCADFGSRRSLGFKAGVSLSELLRALKPTEDIKEALAVLSSGEVK